MSGEVDLRRLESLVQAPAGQNGGVRQLYMLVGELGAEIKAMRRDFDKHVVAFERLQAVEERRHDSAVIQLPAETEGQKPGPPPATVWAWLSRPDTPQKLLWAFVLILAIFGAGPFVETLLDFGSRLLGP